MMQERDVIFNHWDPKSSKRSSGLFSVLKWFKTQETPPDLVNSASSSCSSVESVFSTDTVASFNFVPACNYKPLGGAKQAEKLILPGPESGTYKARIAEREVRRESDKDLTLRSKYKLFKDPEGGEGDRGRSLPLMTKVEDNEKGMHRRTASESSKHRKAGAYLHVKGKRKAPQPPGWKGETLRRKKRMAPQPPANPDVICNDSLKLDRGILKPAKETQQVIQVQEVCQVAPKPWYKRTISKKVDPAEKRKSGNLSFLTNISELDRQAMEILERETLKMKYLKSSPQAPAFMRPRTEHTRTNSDSWVSPKRKSAKDLIAKFNAITTKKEQKPTTPPIQETQPEYIVPIVKEVRKADPEPKRSLPNSPVLRTTASRQISRTPWNCPRCTLENDYWRIICRVCSAIKPYFDDFTTDKDLQRSVFQSNYPRISVLDGKRVEEPKVEEPKSGSSTPKEGGRWEFSRFGEGSKSGSGSSGQGSPRQREASPKVADFKNFFQPRYPRLNLEKYFQKESRRKAGSEESHLPDPEPKRNYEVQKSQSQPRISIFDYERMTDKPRDIPRSNILDEILKEMKKKEEQNRVEESRLEKIAFGSHLGFRKMDDTLETPKRIEKMILGDEIKVERPKEEPKQMDRGKERSPIVEKMILGDEISVKKPDGAKIVGVKLKTLEDEKKDSAKREEREKLKKMLIEMKNSLPKRPANRKDDGKNRVSIVAEEQNEQDQKDEKTVELIIATTETVYENIKVKKTEAPKPIKVSSSVQTNAVVRRAPTPSEAGAIKQSFQLIGAKDFAGITNEKTQDDPQTSHTYANLAAKEESCKPVLSKVFTGRSKTDTLEINRLLRRLETAIAGGELGQAAVLARELAQLKVPCSVVRQKSEDKEEEKPEEFIDIDMYVEDKVSHRGPFPLKVTTTTTVARLKQLVEEKYKIPVGVQRWILGKKLATDDAATLADHQVTTSGCPVFLYLVAPANDAKLEPTAEPVVQEPTAPDVEILEEQLPLKIATITQPPVVLHHQQPVVLPQPIKIEEPPPEPPEELWKCPACTLLNPLVTKECEVCGHIRFAPIAIGEEEGAIGGPPDTYQKLVNLDNEDLVRSVEGFECLICLSDCLVGDGVVLRECLHQFCRNCLANTIEFSEEAEVKCPYRDNQYACDIALQDREVKALVSEAVYERHLAKSVKQAETRIENAFHCKTPDCKGWCIFEDNVNDFRCPVCRRLNCLTCQAIHEGLNCKQYQERMQSQSETDEDARRTRDMLEEMVRKGEALACPTCQVVLMKKWGCDWLRCSMCKTEICWVTRGPRWGVGGKGDTSGGCKCGVNGIKCHPKCNYCH